MTVAKCRILLKRILAGPQEKCSPEHMPAKFVFLIRPLSLEVGFELECEGIMDEPIRVHRLIEAIIAAAQIGQGLEAEVQIFNTAGEISEVLELHGPRAKELLHA
jgi:hypothetical protein